MTIKRRLSRFAPCVQPLECRQLLSSSMPGAEKTIYLDFDGNTLTGTFWNSLAGGVPIVTPAFNGDAATIDKIWQRVSEDFAPFNVNVTTDGPGTAGNSVTVLIGGSSYDWFWAGSGGVAFVGSFGTAEPAFVFAENLNNGEKYVAEAISHEVGHTLGLSHDGEPGVEYHVGHSIMGNSYYAEPSQWSRGEYANANNLEDDIAILASRLGYRTDESDRVLSEAVDVSGIISQSGDTDAFTFTTTGGTVSLTINPASVGANLDIGAVLVNEFGVVVAVSSPDDRLDATITAMLPAGTYTLVIDGVGSANYSDYGSLGQYRVTGTVPPNEPPHAVYGDVNADGVVTRTDYDLVMAAQRNGRRGSYDARYDLNGDGRVDSRDGRIVWDLYRAQEAAVAIATVAAKPVVKKVGKRK